MIVSLITSLVVVTVGSIPFIGLVVPNIVSRLMGDKLPAGLAFLICRSFSFIFTVFFRGIFQTESYSVIQAGVQ